MQTAPGHRWFDNPYVLMVAAIAIGALASVLIDQGIRALGLVTLSPVSADTST